MSAGRSAPRCVSCQSRAWDLAGGALAEVDFGDDPDAWHMAREDYAAIALGEPVPPKTELVWALIQGAKMAADYLPRCGDC